MTISSKQPVTALSGADWAEELDALNNAYQFFKEQGDEHNAAKTFSHVLDVAYRFMAQQKLDAPAIAPWLRQGGVK